MKTRSALITVLFTVAFLSCMRIPVDFDEAKWKRDVENQNIQKLYALPMKEGRYVNPWMPVKPVTIWRFLRWKLSEKASYTDDEMNFRPKVLPHLKARLGSIPDEDFITWIGHGTFLMRLGGEFWITDPIFSDRALLPKRVTPPALDADELGQITHRLNAIISHNHYDHLDANSIRSLPENTRFFVPLGLKEHVESLHGGVVKELKWWQELALENGTSLLCLPAQHWSRRIGQGTNNTLWASYMLTTPQVTIYYGGDSGYFIGYREFRRRFSDITYALLPVTAYHPRWVMHYNHMNPPEALRAFMDLGARYLIPTQWGTFGLGDNPPGLSALDLRKTVEEAKIDPARVLIMDIGQIEVIGPSTSDGPDPEGNRVRSVE